nr:methyltransferase domain-containing protein [Halobacterium bonnevillei]
MLAEDTAETAGKDVVVVDASHRMLVEARGHGLPAVLGDAAQVPLRESAVDAVVITDALHHLPRPGGGALGGRSRPGAGRGSGRA